MSIQWRIVRDQQRADVDFPRGALGEICCAAYFRTRDFAAIHEAARNLFGAKLADALAEAPPEVDFAVRDASVRRQLNDEQAALAENREALARCRGAMEQAKRDCDNIVLAEAADLVQELEVRVRDSASLVESLTTLCNGLAGETEATFDAATKRAAARFRQRRQEALRQLARVAGEFLTEAAVAEQCAALLANRPQVEALLRQAAQQMAVEVVPLEVLSK